MRKIELFLSTALLLSGCYDTDLVFEDQFVPVIQGYLYINKPVEDIRITKMISFGDDTTGATGISNAIVTLQRGSETWTLVNNTADTSYYYSEDEIGIQPGDTFYLQAVIDDMILTSTTIVPPLPPAMTLSSTRLEIPQAEDMTEFRDLEMPDPIEITWEDPDSGYYFFRIDNVEGNPSAIRPDMADRPFRPEQDMIITEPVTDGYYQISPMQVEYYGTHRVIVYSVNDEYVALYSTQSQDSRELNEPFTNIGNGLGLFTAFSSDTFYIEVAAASR
ncbi:MAG: DUF4249 family protein [Bacteroidota bacterium]